MSLQAQVEKVPLVAVTVVLSFISTCVFIFLTILGRCGEITVKNVGRFEKLFQLKLCGK